LFQGKDELLESNLRKWDEFYDKQTRCESITIEVEEAVRIAKILLEKEYID